MHEKIREYICGNRERLLDIISELVAVQSVRGEPQPGAPFGTAPRAALDKAAGMCRSEGFYTRICSDAVGTADLCPDGEFPALGILCHLDVVPAAGQEGWLTDPFKMTEKDGVIYGRGVIDDKGPFAAAFMAMKCIKELGIPLKKGVRLLFGTDEECGSEDLDIYLDKAKEKLPEFVFTPDASFPLINIEKGRLLRHFEGTHNYKGGSVVSFHGGNIPNAVPDKAECVLSDITAAEINKAVSEDTTGAVFEISETGGGVTVRCTGRSAHASTPESGINAVTALIGLLCRLPLARNRDKDMQRDMLHALNGLFPFGETDGRHAGIKASDEKSGALTLVFSIFDMEDGRCSGTADIRFPVCCTLNGVDSALGKSLRNAGFTAKGLDGSEPHIVDENSEFVQKLLKVYERCEGEKGYCISTGGGTYVHNIPGGVAFGVERGDTDYHMHGANEFITVEELLKDAVIYAEAIIEICG